MQVGNVRNSFIAKLLVTFQNISVMDDYILYKHFAETELDNYYEPLERKKMNTSDIYAGVSNSTTAILLLILSII